MKMVLKNVLQLQTLIMIQIVNYTKWQINAANVLMDQAQSRYTPIIGQLHINALMLILKWFLVACFMSFMEESIIVNMIIVQIIMMKSKLVLILIKLHAHLSNNSKNHCLDNVITMWGQSWMMWILNVQFVDQVRPI